MDGIAVLVRDSKNRPGPQLMFGSTSWVEFLTELRN